MPRGSYLNDIEKGNILALHGEGFSIKGIAKDNGKQQEKENFKSAPRVCPAGAAAAAIAGGRVGLHEPRQRRRFPHFESPSVPCEPSLGKYLPRSPLLLASSFYSSQTVGVFVRRE
ncbi:hypothetical protein ABEB36_003250 [Hypothenemus hampei]|uniref:Uncharacterized protein n=1 Tax=Hypothenemus hampei TaxID=57062 RepID=A0ABD1F8K1_HYPHA